MSKQSKIRWSDKDRNIVRNYNANIRRKRKKLIEAGKRYEAAQLPEKVNLRELKKNVTTRKELNKELKRMETFNKTGKEFVIDGSLKKSLHATVRDFNDKIHKLEKGQKYRSGEGPLPEKISVQELIKLASNKENLKEIIKDYKGFLKKGAEELIELPETKNNIKITKWQFELMNRRINEINNVRDKRQKMYEDTEVKYGGKEAGYTQGELRMDKGIKDEYEHMKMYNYSSTYADMRKKLKLIMREKQFGYWDARAELAKLNYIETLEEYIGNSEKGRMIIEKVKATPTSDFDRTLRSEDDLWIDIYDTDKNPEKFDELLSKIWNEWRLTDGAGVFIEDDLDSAYLNLSDSQITKIRKDMRRRGDVR